MAGIGIGGSKESILSRGNLVKGKNLVCSVGARYCLRTLQIDTDALSNFSSILLRADWRYNTTANSGSGILLDLGQWRAS